MDEEDDSDEMDENEGDESDEVNHMLILLQSSIYFALIAFYISSSFLFRVRMGKHHNTLGPKCSP